MVDSKRYEDWLEKEVRDIKSAKVLKENDCGNDVVAFHSQQAIEKTLKGFLINKTSEIFEGHSLIFLCKESSKYISRLRNHLKDCYSRFK